MNNKENQTKKINRILENQLEIVGKVRIAYNAYFNLFFDKESYEDPKKLKEARKNIWFKLIERWKKKTLYYNDLYTIMYEGYMAFDLERLRRQDKHYVKISNKVKQSLEDKGTQRLSVKLGNSQHKSIFERSGEALEARLVLIDNQLDKKMIEIDNYFE